MQIAISKRRMLAADLWADCRADLEVSFGIAVVCLRCLFPSEGSLSNSYSQLRTLVVQLLEFGTAVAASP
jgi:hypothetical protein